MALWLSSAWLRILARLKYMSGLVLGRNGASVRAASFKEPALRKSSARFMAMLSSFGASFWAFLR